MKPRIKNHFRAHQLSIWLRLIPELHRTGMEDVITRHNLFKNHDDLDLYDGSVKLDSLSRLAFLEDTFNKRRNNGTNNEYSLLNINGKLFAMFNCCRRCYCWCTICSYAIITCRPLLDGFLSAIFASYILIAIVFPIRPADVACA